MTLTSLRRGDAYVLDQHLNFRETARTLMGQRTAARLFSTYLSKTSVTDVQALTKGLAPFDISIMSSLRLGICENAPTNISKAGMEAVEKDVDLVDLCTRINIARQACVEQFGSLQVARRNKEVSPLYGLWLQVNGRRMREQNRLLRLRFDREP